MYCQQCDYYEEVNNSFYHIFNPNDYLELVFGSKDETTPEAKEFLNKQWTTIANLARKDFDVFISCVTRPELEMVRDKHDLYWENNPKWIHPILDFDINRERKIIFEADSFPF